MGIPPIVGWFVMDLNGQSQSKMDEEQGYPHDLGNLHIETPCVWSIQIRIHPKDGRCAVIFGFKGYPLVNSPTKLWNITSPFLLGKLSISMAIFNSYVSLPEGISFGQTYVLPDGREKGKPWPAISIRIWECEPPCMYRWGIVHCHVWLPKSKSFSSLRNGCLSYFELGWIFSIWD